MSFSYQEGKCTYWIDLNRGTVPLRILDHYNRTNLDIIFNFDDLVQVPGAGWLPRRMLHVIGTGITVYRLVVKEIDLQHKPPLSAFQLEFPEPVGLGDSARKLVYKRRKTWSLLNLPSRSSGEARPAIPMTYVAPPDLPGELESGPPWVLFGSIIVLLLVSVGAVLFIARRRRRLQGE